MTGKKQEIEGNSSGIGDGEVMDVCIVRIHLEKLT